ncbi:YadA-like family protein [Avibacterium paragallinarum]|uniref:YadA-like family protein n=2 Tax=Avibacterium paragallinarum TaxID=728 RepID=UPI0009DBADCF|nr:YadA-like family protein [Avibacterium paragallinarum]
MRGGGVNTNFPFSSYLLLFLVSLISLNIPSVYGKGPEWQNIKIGDKATATQETRSVVIGNDTTSKGDQAVVIGNEAGANEQSVAVGANVFAAGSGSIAIGGDDLTQSFDWPPQDNCTYCDRLPEATIQTTYANIWEKGFLTEEKFTKTYIKSDNIDLRIYSPTYAAGTAAIALGMRSVAGGDVSTAIGTLSFALAPGSTALGTRAFVSSDANGSTAIGNEARVFSSGATAIGPMTEASAEGAFAYGTYAKAVGEGTLAFGYGSSAGTSLAKINDIRTKMEALGNASTDDNNATQLNNAASAIVNVLKEGVKTVDGSFYESEDSAYLTLAKNGKNVDIKKTKKNQNSSNAIALGRYAFALQENSIAEGYSAISDAIDGIAMGSYAYVKNGASRSLALGKYAYAGAENSIVAGYAARSRSANSLALGANSTIAESSSGAIAIGGKNTVAGSNAIGIGNSNSVNGTNAIALGYRLTVSGENSGAFGDPSAVYFSNSYSFGNNNTIGKAPALTRGSTPNATISDSNTNSFAIGNNNTVSDSNIFVFGSGVTAALKNSVYLGNTSRKVSGDGDNSGSRNLETLYDKVSLGKDGIKLEFGTFAGSNPSSIVTVGNDNLQRLVQGVAAGTISASSTDAINGSQLYATNLILHNVATSLSTVLGPSFQLKPDGSIELTENSEGIGGTDEKNIKKAIAQVLDTAKKPSTVVPTDKDGNRLLEEGGKYYSDSLVSDKAKAKDGKWYDKGKVNADGTVADDAKNDGKTLSELNIASAESKEIPKSEAMLSTVNLDGSTTEPISMGNLKHNLIGSPTEEELKQAEEQVKTDNNLQELNEGQKAKIREKLIQKVSTDAVTKLLANNNERGLSQAVTLSDLKTVASAGLNFVGNDTNNPIHYSLGSTVYIQGSKDVHKYKKDLYSAENLITHNDEGILRIEMKRTPSLYALVLNKGEEDNNKKGYLGLDDEGNIVFNKNKDNNDDKSASKIITEDMLKTAPNLTYKANGEGYKKTEGDTEKNIDSPSVSLEKGLNFVGDKNITTSVEEEGKVNITLADKLTDITSIAGNDKIISFEEEGINVNNAKITGVADGEKDSDAVNKKQLDEVAKNIKNQAIELDKGLKFATNNQQGETLKLGNTLKVKNGTNIEISEIKKEDNESGVFSYTINVKGIPMTYIDKDGKPLVLVGDQFYHLKSNGEVDFKEKNTEPLVPNGIKIVKDSTKLTNKTIENDQLATIDIADGKIEKDSKQAINGGQLAKILGAELNETGELKDKDDGIGGTGKNNIDEALRVIKAKAVKTEVKSKDGNIIVEDDINSGDAAVYKLSLNKEISVEKITLKTGEHQTSIGLVHQPEYQGSEKAIDMGGTRITNLKDGVAPSDAVTVRQMENLERNIEGVRKESRSGIAGAMATAGLLQSTQAGEAVISVSSSTFKGENAIALGFSKLSDNGRIGFRLSGMSTSNGDMGGTVSIGFKW